MDVVDGVGSAFLLIKMSPYFFSLFFLLNLSDFFIIPCPIFLLLFCLSILPFNNQYNPIQFLINKIKWGFLSCDFIKCSF